MYSYAYISYAMKNEFRPWSQLEKKMKKVEINVENLVSYFLYLHSPLPLEKPCRYSTQFYNLNIERVSLEPELACLIAC
jgi:hypothetical protein